MTAPHTSKRFPFPDYPTGWYRIADSAEIDAAALSTHSFFGRELVGFRTGDGAVSVLDAHCPHLGAHLGVGGAIQDDCVVCPFHGWSFDTEGNNVDIPYRTEINRKARLRIYPAQDWCGLVMVWFDEAGQPPTWQLPELPELQDAELLWHRPEQAQWQIRSHPQEILENAVDIAHFQFVHGVDSFGAVAVQDNGPMLRSTAELTLRTPRGPLAGAVVNELWGLGIDVNRVLGIGKASVVLTVTPIDGHLVELTYTFLSPRASDGNGISSFGRGHVKDSIVQLEADFPIWENKEHRANPSLAVGEGAILSFRRWAAQFYATAD